MFVKKCSVQPGRGFGIHGLSDFRDRRTSFPLLSSIHNNKSQRDEQQIQPNFQRRTKNASTHTNASFSWSNRTATCRLMHWLANWTSHRTIRRDINMLARRIFCAVTTVAPGSAATACRMKTTSSARTGTSRKDRIAMLVADHIPDNSSLFMNIGTTVESVARSLLNHSGLKIITNNLERCVDFCRARGIRSHHCRWHGAPARWRHHQQKPSLHSRVPRSITR